MENTKPGMNIEQQRAMCSKIMDQLLLFKETEPVVTDQNTEAILKRMEDIFIYDETKELFNKLSETIIDVRSSMNISKKDEFDSTLEVVLYKFLIMSIADISLRISAVFRLLMQLSPETPEAVKDVGELINVIKKEISSFKHNFNQGTIELEKLKEQQ